MRHSATVAIILASVVLSVGGQLLLKQGMNRMGRVGVGASLLWRAALPWLAAGLALYGISMVFWLLALSRVELSFAFPFIALSYIGIMLSARLSLGERLHGHRLAGALLIILGVLCVSLSA